MILKGMTLVVSPSGSDAAVYDGDELVDCGHYEDVLQRLIERTGITVEYDTDFVTDKSARGWAGVAKSLKELGL